jgi:hypothetical protein
MTSRLELLPLVVVVVGTCALQQLAPPLVRSIVLFDINAGREKSIDL